MFNLSFEVNFDVETFLSHVQYDMKYELGVSSGSQTVPFGDVLSAEIEYFFTDSNNYSRSYHAPIFFNSALVPDFTVINGVENNVEFISDASGSGLPSITSTDRICSLFSGSAYKFDFGHDYLPANTCRILLPSSSVNAYLTDGNTSSPQYSGKIISPTDIKYTTSTALHNRVPSAPYIPLSGDYSYNDIRAIIVDEYNEENPSETISESDFPNFEDYETETGDYQPFSIDYDEILGEREFESILKETQYILDTTPFESVEFPTIEFESMEIESVPSSVGSAVGEIFDISSSMPSDLLAIWGGLAVFAVLFWWLTK